MFEEGKLTTIVKKPETARFVIRSLEKEILKLRKEVANLRGYDGKTDQLGGLDAFLEAMEKEREALRQKEFARSSEKRGGGGKTNEKPKREKPVGSGRGEVNGDLPLKVEEYKLDPQEQHCEECEQEMTPLAPAITKVVDFEPARFVVRQIVLEKNLCTDCGKINVANGPTNLVNGGQYGIDFATEMCVRKYCDHQPLDRIRKSLERDGLMVSTSTLWNQTQNVAGMLDLVYEAIGKSIRQGYMRHADETRWRILDEVSTKTQYVWVFRNRQHVFLTIEATRSGEVPSRVLGDCSGALVADDYAGYNRVVSDNGLIRVHCWAHARRKFVDLEDLYPQIESFLGLVSQLYQKDREFRELGPLTAKRRRQLCQPLIKEILHWRMDQAALPKSKFANALSYLDKCWKGLTQFLDDPQLPLDNNPAENALRGVVLGRKNFWFNRSKRGARVSSILYSICLSCQMNGVNPKAYLRDTVLRIRNCRGFQLPYDYAQNPHHLDLI